MAAGACRAPGYQAIAGCGLYLEPARILIQAHDRLLKPRLEVWEIRDYSK